MSDDHQAARAASPPIVLAFAASDPSGGGGVQADVLTIASMGCHPLSVVTAVGVQDTTAVEALLALDSDWVADQARCLLEDMSVDAFKIGALGSVENASAIAEIISDYPQVPLVLDPVLASGRGDDRASEHMLHVLRELLVPQATIVVTDSISARRIAVDDVDDDDPALAACAERLLASGCEYLLVSAAHEAGAEVVSTLYGPRGVVRSDRWPRLPGRFHGAGCTLASAIAAMLANGLDIADAVKEAQDYAWNTLKRAYRPGMGHWVPDRLFWARDDAVAGEAEEARPAGARTH